MPEHALRRLTLLAAGVVVVIAFAVVLAVVWERRSLQTVHYRGRDYVNPGVMTPAQARDWAPLDDTHRRLLGMELFVPHREVQGGLVPTVIFLRRGDGSYRTYALSGGP